MKPLTQKIYDHLLEAGTISGIEAAALYRCRDLPKRISEIRQFLNHIAADHPDVGMSVPVVRREMKNDPTGQRYARYFLCSN